MPADAAFPQDPQAEDLFAQGLIKQVLAGGKVRITAEMRHGAERLRPAIRASLRRFLRRDSLEGERDLSEFDYNEQLEQLVRLDPEQRMAELAAGAPGEASGLLVIAGRALQYLKGIVPAKARATLLGPESVPPSDFQRYKFRRAYSVIADPMDVFRDMNEGNLSRDQVRTIKVIYPSLYDEAEKMLFMELAELKAVDPGVKLTRDKARQVENLWLTRAWTPELGRAMQAAFNQKPPEEQKPAPLGNHNDDASMTPFQRAEAR